MQPNITLHLNIVFLQPVFIILVRRILARASVLRQDTVYMTARAGPGDSVAAAGVPRRLWLRVDLCRPDAGH